MRRFIGTCAGVAAIALSAGAAAQAAATPTVTTGAAGSITTTTAVLHGHIDPQGSVGSYTFNYGPTPAYGSVTVARSAGSGTNPVAVTDTITGLSPGTTYHFQIAGTNAAGGAVGADASFTTKGVAPSAATTGPATAVGKTTATVSGTITPGAAQTGWYVQYGTTTSYGSETFQQELPAGTAAVPVSLGLTGLAPATLFHYRIVSLHGTLATYGADATFFTEPVNRPSADMATKTTPKSDAKAPFAFTTSGTLKGGTYIPAAQRCSGTVGIHYYNGKHQLAVVVADVAADCTFSAKVAFKKLHGTGPATLRVSVFYRGNAYLKSASKIDHPTAGKKPTAKKKK